MLKYSFSPGRIELLGNHTDHNLGKVLVMTINLALLAAVKKNNSNFIRASFDQDDEFIVVDLEDTLPKRRITSKYSFNSRCCFGNEK